MSWWNFWRAKPASAPVAEPELPQAAHPGMYIDCQQDGTLSVYYTWPRCNTDEERLDIAKRLSAIVCLLVVGNLNQLLLHSLHWCGQKLNDPVVAQMTAECIQLYLQQQ